jgi:DNA-binding response OmpR family regulator
VVEGNERLAAALRAALIKQGQEVVCALTRETALELLERTSPDAVLLDLGLPDCDGITLCSTIRASSPVPIVVTSVRTDHASRIRALESGADDCLVKPYNLAEFLARVRAVIRRRFAVPSDAGTWPEDVVLAGPIRIDLRERVVLVNGIPTELSDHEFDILVALARHPDQTLAADRLVDEILRVQRAALRAALPHSITSLRERLGAWPLLEDDDQTGYRLSIGEAV